MAGSATSIVKRSFVPVAVLTIEGDDPQVAPMMVEAEGCVIGRSSIHGAVLRDSSVSRAHARLEVRQGEFWIVDLGSSNGTIVNGFLVSQCQLKSGDRILLGETTLVFDKRLRLAGYQIG